MSAEVEAFLHDPEHFRCDDGSTYGAPTDRPELYRPATLRRRLLPVLTRLSADDFRLLARDRNLLILAAPTSREKPQSPPGTIDPVAHGAGSFSGHYPWDAATSALDRPPGSWVLKLGRLEVELAPRLAFAGIVIHECMHVLLGYQPAAGTVDAAAEQQLEDEAVRRACNLGFRRETVAFRNFFATRFPDVPIIGRLPPA